MTDMETGAAVAGQSSSFEMLPLVPALKLGLADNKFTTPTQIQAEAIPYGLEGHDLLGIARTGTGKTAAFVLPIMNALSQSRGKMPPRHIRALILAPTRELAVQIDDTIRSLGKHTRLRSFAVLGGVGRRPQVDRIFRGVDIVVGTPGRINDLMSTGDLRLDLVSHFVLDEGDQMLDFGFIHDVRKIANALPEDRQSMLFSATMPPQVASLAQSLLTDPIRVEVARAGETPAKIDQHVYFVEGGNKQDLLINLLEDKGITRTIVFTRTKHGANRLSDNLFKAGIRSEALHGNKSQAARQKSLDRFRAGESRVLIATDIAARGIDVPDVSHVINYDIPNVPESYVHRIGRTARNGASGTAVSFCASDEAAYLRDIQRLTGQELNIQAGDWPSKLPKRGAASQPRRPQRPKFEGEKRGRDFRGGDDRNDRFSSQQDRPQSSRPRWSPMEGDAPQGKPAFVKGDRGDRGDRPFREDRPFRQDRPFRGDRQDGRSFEGKRPEGRPFEGRSSEGRSPEGRSPEGRSFEGRSFEGKRHEGRSFEGKRPEGRSFEGRPSEGRSFEGKRHEGRSFEGKRHEGRSFDGNRADGGRFEGKRFEGKRFDGPRAEGDHKPARRFRDDAPRSDFGRADSGRSDAGRSDFNRADMGGDRPARRESMPRPYKGKGEQGGEFRPREDRPYRAADHGDRPLKRGPKKEFAGKDFGNKDFGGKDRPQADKKSFGGKSAFSKLRKPSAA